MINRQPTQVWTGPVRLVYVTVGQPTRNGLFSFEFAGTAANGLPTRLANAKEYTDFGLNLFGFNILADKFCMTIFWEKSKKYVALEPFCLP